MRDPAGNKATLPAVKTILPGWFNYIKNLLLITKCPSIESISPPAENLMPETLVLYGRLKEFNVKGLYTNTT